MKDAHPGRAIWAGFIATLIMTLLAYSGPAVGMPKMDFAALLGSVFATEAPQPWSGPWWLGMIIHFIDGSVIFALIYAYWIYRFMPGPNWLRGAQWGVILWIMSESIVLPAMGLGFFSANMPQPFIWALASLIGHLVYGALLGALAAEQAVALPTTERYMVQSREHRHEYNMRNKSQRLG
jgi:uncharacterized membrane protein YagU involved in acid resistance